eukprot:15478489-Alexandrium_andersonii.AAC.1
MISAFTSALVLTQDDAITADITAGLMGSTSFPVPTPICGTGGAKRLQVCGWRAMQTTLTSTNEGPSVKPGYTER